MRRKNFALFCLFICTRTLAGSTDILNAGTHADDKITPAVNAVLGSVPMHVDYDPSGGLGNIVSQTANLSGVYHTVGTTSPNVNHAVYGIGNASYCRYTVNFDQDNYASLESNATLVTVPNAVKQCGALPAGTAPGVVTSQGTSANSINGGTGWGSEFEFSASYLGLDTSEDSWVSAELAGFYAALKNNHGSWNWFDIKGALRQTAANWSTGYNHLNYGYGILNWSSANSVASPANIYLQPPGIAVQNFGYYATVTLYPFRQTRRDHEELRSCTAGYSWPVKNEYSLSDVTAGCPTLLYMSNGTDVEPTTTYAPAMSGTITLIAFTTDGSGAYSREEEFSPMTESFLVGTQCLH